MQKLGKVKRSRYDAALFKAVYDNQAGLVSMLLRRWKSRCLLMRDERGNSPLHWAAVRGSSELAKHLLEAGCDVNARNLFDDTALSFAVVYGNEAVVAALLQAGANVHYKNCFEDGVLHYAVSSKNLGIMKLLLEHGARPGDLDCLKRSAMHLAVAKKQTKMVRLMLEGDCQQLINDVSCGKGPLHLAIGVGSERMSRMLVAAGADVNIRDWRNWTPLHYAAKKRNVDLAQFIIDVGASVDVANDIRMTPLHQAVQDAEDDLVQLLLLKGASVTAKTVEGNTALHHLAIGDVKSYDTEAILKTLIKCGADVNAPNNRCETPFHLLLEKGAYTLVCILLDNKADITTRDGDGRTALHFAAKNNDSRVVERILKYGGINVLDTNAVTPIFYMAQQLVSKDSHPNLIAEYRRCIQLMLQHGADVNHQTLLGENVLELSLKRSNLIMMDMIIEQLALEESADLQMSKKNRQLIVDNNIVRSCYSRCESELLIMKAAHFYGTVTYHKLLVASAEVAAGFARNAELVAAFRNSHYTEDFPIYRRMLEEKLDKGVARQNSLDSAATCLNDAIGIGQASHPMYERILSYLNEEDLFLISF